MSGRFDVGFGNWLPEDCEEILVCECPNCDREIYEGEDVLEYEGELFCDAGCLIEYLGAVYKEAILERND